MPVNVFHLPCKVRWSLMRSRRIRYSALVVASLVGGCNLFDGLGGISDGPLPDTDAGNVAHPGTGDPPPSCVGLVASCGSGKECCGSNIVVGGSFNRNNDPNAPA